MTERKSPFQFLRSLTAPHPAVQNVGDRRRASLAANISLILFIFIIFGIVTDLILNMEDAAFAGLIGLGVAFLVSYILSRTIHFRLGAVILTIVFVVIAVFLALTEPTPLNEVLYSVLPLMFIIAIALFNQRGMWMLFFSTMAGMVVIAYFKGGAEQELAQAFGITSTIGIMAIIVVRFRDSVEQSSIKELKKLNEELGGTKSDLEKRVQERTTDLNVRALELERYARQMEAVSKVARVIASIQDLDRLLPTITQVVSEQFGFYHTGIFLLNEQTGYAVLQAANSEGGKRMLQRGHRLRIGAIGIVGYVAAHGEPRIALDVGADAVYFNNPDLPNTRSEMALPLKVAGQTIGALDIQSIETNAFKAEDIAVLTTLANQIAIAIENARLFSQTNQALAESRSVYDEYVKQEWARFAQQFEQTGYSYDGIKATPITTAGKPDGDQAKRIPIRIRGLVVGHISIRSNDPLREWTRDELNLVEAAAERAGLAIENARLLTEAQRRASKERLIGEISSRISGSIDINSIMQTAVEELGRTMPGSEVILQFREKDQAKE